ncbi:extracellular solute-binding protein [Roseomonas sp. CCTCC AB2023176]|uniref:extracellular solute-binding protein n=1 Tax=Roseomonas sp. CCTCC AB2023176 TaxID=3342640 RepID=UPI0035E3749B
MHRRAILLGAAASLAAPAVPKAQARTLSWVTHPVILQATGDGELLRRFEAATGIRVEPVTFPTEVLGQRIQQELIARSAAFDVLSVADAFWTTSLARFCEPLDPLIRAAPPAGGMDDFSPGMVQQFRVPQTPDGPILGIPQRVSVSLLYYRADLLRAAGLPVPRTLEAFVAAAKELTRGGISGAVYQGLSGQAGVLDWYEMAAPLGADLLAAPDWKRAAFNSPGGVKALEARRRLITDGSVNAGAVGYGFDDAINAVAQGRAAMSVLFSAYWPRFADRRSSTVADTIAYAAPMRDDGVSPAYPARGWAMSVNRASAKKEMAWEFIRFLTDAPQQKWMAIEKGNPVSRLSVVRDPEFVAAVPIAAALGEALPHAKIMPNVPQLPRVYDALSRHLGAALAGTASARDALAAAEGEVNRLLA